MIRAGVAGADITPSPGPILQGHKNDRPSHSVLYPLELRTLVIEREGECLVLITVDAAGLFIDRTQRLTQRIGAAHDIDPASIAVVCSHTHCGPPTLPILGAEPHEPFLEQIERQASNTVGQALASLKPVRLGLGCGSVHFNCNRRPGLNPQGLVDRRARVLRIDAHTGERLAVLFHYSCHPTTYAGSNARISPDYPGIARRHIEEQVGCPALFLPGACGDVRPAVYDAQGQPTKSDLGALDRCGHELGREVVRVVESLRSFDDDRFAMMSRDLSFALGAPDERWLQGLADDPAHADLRGPLAHELLERRRHASAAPSPRASLMQVAQIGSLTLAFLPGEPVQAIGHEIERRGRHLAGLPDIWPCGFANDLLCYLCTPAQHEEGGYEPEAWLLLGYEGPFQDEARSLYEAADDLLSHLV